MPCFSILRRFGLAGGAFGVVSLYLAHNGQSAPRIGGRVAAGGVSARVGVSFGAGGAAYPPHPTPETRPRNLGCLSKKFFYFFIFLFFYSSFAGFFRVKGSKIEYFLDVGIVIGCRNAKFGHF